jgi:hypothetical protein
MSAAGLDGASALIPSGVQQRLLKASGTSPAQLPRVSATVRATKFPCIEYVFYFAQRESVMPDGFWYVNISVQSEPRTFVFEREK